MDLATFWFIVLGVLWTGYLVLEGFDFGVGMLLPVLGGKRYVVATPPTPRSAAGVLLNTIGPVWDGNEVWVLTAGGATFAAFPHWYATLFSGFYLPLLLILVALIVRNLGFEYRHKRPEAEWKARWDQAIFWGSLVPALLWGVALTNIVRGVPIDAQQGVHRQPLHPAQPGRPARRARLRGALPHARRDLRGPQDRREDPPRGTPGIAERVGVVAAVLAVVLLLWIGLTDGKPASWVTTVVAAVALLGALAGQPGRARGLGLHRHGGHDRHGGRDVLHRALPQRHAVARPTRPTTSRSTNASSTRLHAQGHDDRRADLHADRADLPGLDVLGLPEALDHQAHSGGRTARAAAR